LKICPKCETIALGDSAILCPDCGESLLDYQTMKVNLKTRSLQLEEQVSEKHVEDVQKRIDNVQKRIDNVGKNYRDTMQEVILELKLKTDKRLKNLEEEHEKGKIGPGKYKR